MENLKKVLVSKMKVRFHDCDPFNHLNNSRYLDYIITARGDQLLDNYGFDIYRIAREQGIGWVTAQTQVSYLAPAFLMEEVSIETQLIDYSARSLLFEAVMRGEDPLVIKAVMWGKLVHFNLQAQKSQLHSDALMEFFARIVNPVPGAPDFESRIKIIKQQP